MSYGLYYGQVRLSKIADLNPLFSSVGSGSFDCLFISKDGSKTEIKAKLEDFGKWFNTTIDFGEINSFARQNQVPMIYYAILPELTMLGKYDEAVAMNLLVYQLRYVRAVSEPVPIENKLAIKMNGIIYNLTNVSETALLISDLAQYYFEHNQFPETDMKLLSNVLCNLKGFNLELGNLDFPSFISARARMHLDQEGFPVF
jgi:hypothetical protein